MIDPVTQLLVDSRDAILTENVRLKARLAQYEQRDIPAPAPQGHETGGVGSSDPLRSKLAAEIEAGIPALRAFERERARREENERMASSYDLGVKAGERRITAAVLAEREACAAMCDRECGKWADIAQGGAPNAWPRAQAFGEAAFEIRSRPAPAAETNSVDGGGSSAARASDCDSGDGGSIPLHHTTNTPDRAKLVEAMRKVWSAWGVDTNDQRTICEFCADAALAFFAESAPVRHVVPAAVRAFVESFSDKDGYVVPRSPPDERMPDRLIREIETLRAARAAIDSLDKGSEPARYVVGVDEAGGLDTCAAVMTKVGDDGVIQVLAEGHGRTADDAFRECLRSALDTPPSISRAAVPESPARCEVCGWPLAESREKGCVDGDCSYRPADGTDEGRRIHARRAMLAALDSGASVLVERGELERLREEVASLRAMEMTFSRREPAALRSQLAAAERRASDAEAEVESLRIDRNVAMKEIERLKECVSGYKRVAHGAAKRDAELYALLGGEDDETLFCAARRVIAERDAALKREVVLPKSSYETGPPRWRDGEIKSANPGVAFKEPMP